MTALAAAASGAAGAAGAGPPPPAPGRLRPAGDGAYLAPGAAGLLAAADCAAFDCDGVLVDVSESYDAAIGLTVRHVLGRLAGIEDPPAVTPAVISAFKASGGFNDEVDLAYAAALSAAAARQLGAEASAFMLDTAAHADDRGVASVERHLARAAPDIRGIRRMLGPYPPEPGLPCPVRDAFDQLFYGPALYERLAGACSEFSGAGLIERDRVIITEQAAGSLRGRFSGRISLVTGRGIAPARHTLGALLDGFDLSASRFLEDEPRAMAKPNPEPLLRSIRAMGGSRCLYVGDSYEDLLMAKRADAASGAGGIAVAFCGITGTAASPRRRLAMFDAGGAHAALDSVLLLPRVLADAAAAGRGRGRGRNAPSPGRPNA